VTSAIDSVDAARQRRGRPEGTRGRKRGAGQREGNRLERAGDSDDWRATTTTTVVSQLTVDRGSKPIPTSKAQEGITDQTLLADAGVALNSAAFAVQVTWLHRSGRGRLPERRATSRSSDEGAVILRPRRTSKATSSG
jgi:hypothetical protein